MSRHLLTFELVFHPNTPFIILSTANRSVEKGQNPRLYLRTDEDFVNCLDFCSNWNENHRFVQSNIDRCLVTLFNYGSFMHCMCQIPDSCKTSIIEVLCREAHSNTSVIPYTHVDEFMCFPRNSILYAVLITTIFLSTIAKRLWISS